MVCEGCLSADRNLTIVEDDVLNIYLSFLDTAYSDKFVQLCWECGAVFKRFLKFKQQVKHAHTTLLSYLIPQSKSLSNLAITKCNNTIRVYVENESELMPTTFVKIEDEARADSLDSWHDDLDYKPADDGGDAFHGHWEQVNDEEKLIKTDGKVDPAEVPESKKVKSRKRSKTRDVFNESDDEPLKACEGDKSKPRGKRKKKIEVDGAQALQVKGGRQSTPGVVRNARVLSKLQRLNADAEQLEMVILSWEEVEAERQSALASDAFLRHQHRCYSCVLGFNHRCKLDDHNAKKHHPSCGAELCGVCEVRLRSPAALRAHRRRHLVRWRCRSCGAAWSRAEVAADHAARAHGARAPAHTCRACGHTETSLGKLRNHIKSHSEKQKCELCGKMFRNKDSLRTHLFIHKGEKEHACPRCGKQFLFKKAMELHLVSHDASALLYCYQCDVNFKNQMSFNQHMKYNLKHVDPAKLKHACGLCDKRFVKAARLEEHRRAVHLKLTPVRCAEPGCRFACSSRPVLRTHVRMLHRNARAKRDHVCDVCGKAYSTKKSLEGHLRTHSGERPFRCAACPAAFGYQAALYNHNKLVHLKHKKVSSRSAVQEWPAAAPPPTDKATTQDHSTIL